MFHFCGAESCILLLILLRLYPLLVHRNTVDFSVYFVAWARCRGVRFMLIKPNRHTSWQQQLLKNHYDQEHLMEERVYSGLKFWRGRPWRWERHGSGETWWLEQEADRARGQPQTWSRRWTGSWVSWPLWHASFRKATPHEHSATAPPTGKHDVKYLSLWGTVLTYLP